MEYFLKIVAMIRPIVEFTQFLTISLVLRTVARHMTPTTGNATGRGCHGSQLFFLYLSEKVLKARGFDPNSAGSFKLQLDLNWRILTWQSHFCWQGSDFDQSKVQSRWSCCFYWKLLFDQNHGEMTSQEVHMARWFWCPSGVSIGAIRGPLGGWDSASADRNVQHGRSWTTKSPTGSRLLLGWREPGTVTDGFRGQE